MFIHVFITVYWVLCSECYIQVQALICTVMMPSIGIYPDFLLVIDYSMVDVLVVWNGYYIIFATHIRITAWKPTCDINKSAGYDLYSFDSKTIWPYKKKNQNRNENKSTTENLWENVLQIWFGIMIWHRGSWRNNVVDERSTVSMT